MVDLRLRACGRSACFPSCRAAHSAIACSLLRLCSSCDAMRLGVFYSAVKAF